MQHGLRLILLQDLKNTCQRQLQDQLQDLKRVHPHLLEDEEKLLADFMITNQKRLQAPMVPDVSKFTGSDQKISPYHFKITPKRDLLLIEAIVE